MDPPEYRYSGSTAWNCAFCAHERDIHGWATCAKYGCRTLLNSLCESFEARGERDRPLPTPEEMERLDGPWMKYPYREPPPPPKPRDDEDWPWRRSAPKQETNQSPDGTKSPTPENGYRWRRKVF